MSCFVARVATYFRNIDLTLIVTSRFIISGHGFGFLDCSLVLISFRHYLRLLLLLLLRLLSIC